MNYSVHLPLCSINQACCPTTQPQYFLLFTSGTVSTRGIPNSSIFNCDVISKRLTWSSTRFFLKETILWILVQEKRSDLNPADLAFTGVLLPTPGQQRNVLWQPGWTVTGHTSAENSGSQSQRENKKGEGKKCCVVCCSAQCVGRHHSPVILKHIQRQL